MTTSAEPATKRPKRPIYPGLNDNLGGRPSPIGAKFDHRDDGTTRTVAEALVDFVAAGDYLTDACAAVGIERETAREWLRVAARVRIANDGDPNPDNLGQHEANCLKFSDGFAKALSAFKHDKLAEVDQIGRGGRRVTKIRRKRVYKNANDKEGSIAWQVEEIEQTQPDLRAIMFRLQHRFPGEFSPKMQVSNVEDFTLSDDEVAESLAEKLEIFLQGHDAGKAEAAEVPEAGAEKANE